MTELIKEQNRLLKLKKELEENLSKKNKEIKKIKESMLYGEYRYYDNIERIKDDRAFEVEKIESTKLINKIYDKNGILKPLSAMELFALMPELCFHFAFHPEYKDKSFFGKVGEFFKGLLWFLGGVFSVALITPVLANIAFGIYDLSKNVASQKNIKYLDKQLKVEEERFKREQLKMIEKLELENKNIKILEEQKIEIEKLINENNEKIEKIKETLKNNNIENEQIEEQENTM